MSGPDLLTRSIDALASRQDLSADQSAAVLGGDHGRQGLGDPDRRVPDRAADQGRDGQRAGGAGPDDARARHPGGGDPGRPARHRRHRRRAADVQRLDHGGADRRRSGLRRGQARQPLGDRAVGLGRRAGGARGPDRPRAPAAVARCIEETVGLRLHVRARPPPGDPLRGPGPARAGGADDLQLPRPAHQSAGATAS